MPDSKTDRQDRKRKAVCVMRGGVKMRNNYIKERMNELEREINAEALQREMMRKTKEYSNRYRG